MTNKNVVDKYLLENATSISEALTQPGFRWAEVASYIDCDVSPEYVRSRWRKLKPKLHIKQPSGKFQIFSGYENKEKGSKEFTFTADNIPTEEEITSHFKIDTTKWKIVNIYHKTTPSGKYSITVQVNLKKPSESIDYGKAFTEFLATYNERVLKKDYPKRTKAKEFNDGTCMLELSIPDLHLAKLGHDKEVGEDYDLEIAKSRYIEAVKDLLEKASFQHNLEKVLLVVGNDFFNADNKFQTTTSGTPQDCDSRWHKMFKEGLELITDAIDLAGTYCDKLDVLIVPGNHDRHTSYYLGIALEAFYRNIADINIDSSPKTRKYYTFGANLLGFTHGDKEKHDSLPLIMAQECSDSWSFCRYKEWHLGHLHTNRNKAFLSQNEFNGVQVRILPSLTTADAWHYESGYIGNEQRAIGIVYEYNKGKQAEFYHTVM